MDCMRPAMTKLVRCCKADDPKCPISFCSHKAPHLPDNCTSNAYCYGSMGHDPLFRVRCVAVKEKA
jgi:hypothetical protein